MPDPFDSPYLVPFDGSFRVADAATTPPAGTPGKSRQKRLLEQRVQELSELQRVLYAHDRHAVLLVFQAMDAAGKDGTIRAVLSGVNPTGCKVVSFKQPSVNELDHDFLWRTARQLPERGRIGVFNRSYYEEVLIVRVHRAILEAQRLPLENTGKRVWKERLESIRDHERHLARSGYVVIKFWLNVSREEQRRRFLARIDEPQKNWKFAVADVRERDHWKGYMRAYEQALRATSRPWAPWYAIPADDKPYMRAHVASIVVKTLRSLDLRYPEVAEAERARFDEMRALLEGEA